MGVEFIPIRKVLRPPNKPITLNFSKEHGFYVIVFIHARCKEKDSDVESCSSSKFPKWVTAMFQLQSTHDGCLCDSSRYSSKNAEGNISFELSIGREASTGNSIEKLTSDSTAFGPREQCINSTST